MKLKYYLRGLGIGVLVTTLVLTATDLLKPDMTDAQIKERAAKLGMVEAYEKGVLSEDEDSKEAVSEDKIVVEKPALLQEDEAQKEVSANQTENAKETTEKNETVKADDKTGTAGSVKEDTSKKDDDVVAKKDADGTKKEGDDSQKKDTVKQDDSKQDDSNQDVKKSEKKEEPAKEDKPADDRKQDAAQGDSIKITVNSGEGSQTVARKLAQAGIVSDAAAFDRYLCQNGYDSRIAVGTYEFTKGMTDGEAANRLMRK